MAVCALGVTTVTPSIPARVRPTDRALPTGSDPSAADAETALGYCGSDAGEVPVQRETARERGVGWRDEGGDSVALMPICPRFVSY